MNKVLGGTGSPEEKKIIEQNLNIKCDTNEKCSI